MGWTGIRGKEKIMGQMKKMMNGNITIMRIYILKNNWIKRSEEQDIWEKLIKKIIFIILYLVVKKMQKLWLVSYIKK